MTYVFHPEPLKEWDEYCFFEDAFTPEECEKIKGLSKIIEAKPAYTGSDASAPAADPTVRKSTLHWVNWSSEHDWIFQRLWHSLSGANTSRYKMDLTGFLEALQLTHYKFSEGQPPDHYQWHQDSGPNQFSIRKLSIVVQLSNEQDYTGGELQFFTGRDPKTLPKKQGTIVVFPSYQMHRVTNLESGERFSLVVWASGPPYR